MRVLLTALAAAVVLAAPASAASPDVVITQVYGGGGNSGATLRSDFIELYNRGTAPMPLTETGDVRDLVGYGAANQFETAPTHR